MSDETNLWSIAVGSWTIKMDGYTLGESLGAEYGAEKGSSGEISSGELEGEELGESGTEVCSSGEMSGGNGYGNLEGYPLVEKLFGSECITKVGTSVGRSYGKVDSSGGR